MTLATRCAACGTAFRVVEDQLKVSDGWVRCGSCNGVFDASEHLFNLPEEVRSEGDPSPIGVSIVDDAASEPPAGDERSNNRTPAVQQSEDLHAPQPEPAAEADAEPALMGQAAEPTPRDLVRDQPHNAEPLIARAEFDTDIASASADSLFLNAEESDKQVVAQESVAASSTPHKPNHPALADEATDTAFESTVAVSVSSEFPSSVSGFGASQPHSAFRDSDAPPDSRIDAHLFKTRRRPATKTLSERDRPDFSDARFDSDLMAYEDDGGTVGTTASDQPVTDSESAEQPEAPGFLRHAEQSDRWQRPKVRVALALGAATLAIGGLLQTAHHFRDTAAVRWPGLRPMLAQWCEMANCIIEPLRKIEAISVESTALAKAPGTEAFRLAVGLRNLGSVPVALPWIDLSLTDGAGRLVARKALAAAEFNPPSPLLQPGADVVLQTLLSARGLQVTGYTVEVFYP